MRIISKYKCCACTNMGLLWKDNETNKENDGELESNSPSVSGRGIHPFQLKERNF